MSKTFQLQEKRIDRVKERRSAHGREGGGVGGEGSTRAPTPAAADVLRTSETYYLLWQGYQISYEIAYIIFYSMIMFDSEEFLILKKIDFERMNARFLHLGGYF